MSMNAAKTAFEDGIAAAQSGDFSRAEAIARSIFARDPSDVGALQIVGFSAFRQGKNTEALQAFIRANQIEPGQPQILYWLGVLYKERGDFAQGERAFSEMLKLAPGHGEAWCCLAEIYYLTDRRDLASKTFESAIAAEPQSTIVLARAARFFETTHNADRAHQLLAEALRIDPASEIAQISALEFDLRNGLDGAVIESAAALINEGPGANRRNQARIHHIAATANDRLGDHARAFHHYSEANRLQSALDLHVARTTPSPLQTENLQGMIRFLRSNPPSDWPRHIDLEGKSPVFLMGFVRSGTTWLDQILSSHPQISVMEEEDNFIDSWRRFSLSGEALVRMPLLSRRDINALRAAYWKRAHQSLRGREAREVVVDKLPLNTVQLALVWRLFPEAKIIFVVRDPRDAVFSAFQQHFQVNPGMAHFLTIRGAAEFYDQVMTIGEIMRATAPLVLHEVRYENIVADFDGEIRRVLEFIGVGWNDSVRNYRETALGRAVRTPSARQVIEKPFASSIGKWRRYRDGMTSVLPILAPWVEKFGYDPD